MSGLGEELRTTFLFERLSDEQLDWLVDRGEVCAFDRAAHRSCRAAPGTASRRPTNTSTYTARATAKAANREAATIVTPSVVRLMGRQSTASTTATGPNSSSW